MAKPSFVFHSYPWYFADWRSSKARRRLCPEAKALYREVLDECYVEGSVPDDIAELAVITALPEKLVRKHWTDLKEYLIPIEGGYTHHKVDGVMGKIKKSRDVKSKAGKASAEKRNSRSTHVEQTLNSSSTVVQPSVGSTVVQPSSSSSPSTTTTDGGDVVEALWKIHPSPSEGRYVSDAYVNEKSVSAMAPDVFDSRIIASLRDWTAYWTEAKRFPTGLRKWIESGDYARRPPGGSSKAEPKSIYRDLRDEDLG